MRGIPRVKKAFRPAVMGAAKAVLLIVAGIGLAAFVIAYRDYSANHWVPPKAWLQLVPFTAVAFGSVVPQFRRSWRRPLFWMIVLGLLVVHVTGYVMAFGYVESWRLTWFVPLTMGEVPLLVKIGRAHV